MKLTFLRFCNTFHDSIRNLVQFFTALFAQLVNDCCFFGTAVLNIYHAAHWLANVFFGKRGQRIVIAVAFVNLSIRTNNK